jgi:hypothetical protein
MQQTKTKKQSPIYDCEICSKGFSTPNDRNKHTCAKHQTYNRGVNHSNQAPASKPTGVIIFCDLCGYRFNSTISYNQHIAGSRRHMILSIKSAMSSNMALLVKDKGGLVVTSDANNNSFGDVNMGTVKIIRFTITNHGQRTRTFTKWGFLEQATKPELRQEDERGVYAGLQRECIASGKSYEVLLHYRPDQLGTVNAFVVFNFESFVIGRAVTGRCVPNDGMPAVLLPTTPYVQKKRRRVRVYGKDIVTYTGDSANSGGGEQFSVKKMKAYEIDPPELKDNKEALEKHVSADCSGEMKDHKRFHCLLWAEEVQALKEIDDYTMPHATFQTPTGGGGGGKMQWLSGKQAKEYVLVLDCFPPKRLEEGREEEDKTRQDKKKTRQEKKKRRG